MHQDDHAPFPRAGQSSSHLAKARLAGEEKAAKVAINQESPVKLIKTLGWLRLACVSGNQEDIHATQGRADAPHGVLDRSDAGQFHRFRDALAPHFCETQAQSLEQQHFLGVVGSGRQANVGTGFGKGNRNRGRGDIGSPDDDDLAPVKVGCALDGSGSDECFQAHSRPLGIGNDV
jgi:hypothetical protein